MEKCYERLSDLFPSENQPRFEFGEGNCCWSFVGFEDILGYINMFKGKKVVDGPDLWPTKPKISFKNYYKKVMGTDWEDDKKAEEERKAQEEKKKSDEALRAKRSLCEANKRFDDKHGHWYDHYHLNLDWFVPDSPNADPPCWFL